MPKYRKTIISGDVIEIEEYTSIRSQQQAYFRRPGSFLPTSEEKAEWNRTQAVKKLCRLINTNFKEGDLFITLTHRERSEDPEKELTNFLRRLKRWRQRKKLPALKYIGVTEHGKREHHHLIVNAMPLEAIYELWSMGRIMVSRVEPGGDYTGLAVYITKEGHLKNKRRWRQSKNLEKPKVIIKIIKVKRKRKIMPPKGYSVRESYEFESAYGSSAYMKAVRIGGADYGGG